MLDELIPNEARIYGWIEEVFAHGVRRPGYPADRWAEEWTQEQFRAFGLERVRAEPVSMPYWEPLEASLVVTGADGAAIDVPCFPLPFAAATDGAEADLVPFDGASAEAARGAVASLSNALSSAAATPIATVEGSLPRTSGVPIGEVIRAIASGLWPSRARIVWKRRHFEAEPMRPIDPR